MNDSLDASLYEGGSLASDVPYLGPVAIAGHIFQIDASKYKRNSLPSRRPSSDFGQEPSEQSLSREGLWKRTASDWRYGAGQRFFDVDAASVRERFFASKGIDALSTVRQISMLHDTERKLVSAASNLDVRTIGAWQYLIDGVNLRFTADPTPASPTYTTVAAPALILSLATDGANLYVASSGQAIQKATVGSGGAMAAFGAFVATVVGYANGRLLAGAANRLVEVGAAGVTGGSLLDYTHVNPSFVWKGIVGTPSAIYAWGDAGGASEVYFIVPDPATGVLRPPTWAWSVPAGQTVTAMLWYSTVMAIGTTSGLLLATQASAGPLTNGARIDVPGGVTALCADGPNLWFSWTNYDGVSTGLGRANLGLLVDAANLVPAYASDLMATTQGAVIGCASFGGRRYFAVSGSGVWGQNANLVPSATIDSGWISFTTIERKIVVSADLRHDPLVGSVSVAVDLDTDYAAGGQRLQLSTSNKVGTVGPSLPFSASNQPFERCKVQITLNRSGTDPTAGPVLRRWTLRGLPTPARTDEIIVPLRMHTVEQSRGGQGENTWQDVLAEFQYLKSLEASGAIVRYQEGTTSYDVYIDGIQVTPEKIDAAGAFFEGILGVRMLTVTPAA